MSSIMNKVKSWFGKQERWELASDQRHEQVDTGTGGGHHKEHMMDEVLRGDQEIADEEGL